jgi:hypothetical protein
LVKKGGQEGGRNQREVWPFYRVRENFKKGTVNNPRQGEAEKVKGKDGVISGKEQGKRREAECNGVKKRSRSTRQ